VDAEARAGNFLKRIDVPCAGGGEHFAGLNRDVAGHGVLVGTPVTMIFSVGMPQASSLSLSTST